MILDDLRVLLDASLRISVEGGRTFRGRLVAVDPGLNLILSETLEERSTTAPDPQPRQERAVGLVMIPGKDIKSAHLC